MGTDASHRGDPSQHTAPLPTAAVLPSDTPIAPTPEQVNKPGQSQEGRGGRRPLRHVRADCRNESHCCGASPGSSRQPHGCVLLSPFGRRGSERNSFAQGHTACPRQSWDSSSSLSSSRLSHLCPVRQPFSRLLRGALRQGEDVPAGSPSPAAAPCSHSCRSSRGSS